MLSTPTVACIPQVRRQLQSGWLQKSGQSCVAQSATIFFRPALHSIVKPVCVGNEFDEESIHPITYRNKIRAVVSDHDLRQMTSQ